MKTGAAAMWASWKTYGALLFAFGLAVGCGKTGTTESGETHFVSCSSDTDCAGVTGAHTCSGGLCRGPANEDMSATPKPPACDGGCGDAECAAPGTCTLAAACNVVDCGTALVDDNACVRPSCENDTDCPDDERCAAVWSGKHYQCVQNGASCDCEVGLGLFPVNVCSPVSLAGTRGQWQKLVVIQNTLPPGDSTIRTLYPDGSMSIERRSAETDVTESSMAQLSAEDLDELTREINGTSLRLELAGPAPCPMRLPNPGDGRFEWTVDLYLGEDGTGEAVLLTGEVTFCSSFTSLLQLASKY